MLLQKSIGTGCGKTERQRGWGVPSSAEAPGLWGGTDGYKGHDQSLWGLKDSCLCKAENAPEGDQSARLEPALAHGVVTPESEHAWEAGTGLPSSVSTELSTQWVLGAY